MDIFRNNIKKIFSVLAGISIFLASSGAWCDPGIYMEKVGAMPDMGQYDGIGYLPLRGQGYCAPVAISNSLMWLAENGYPHLVDSTGDRRMTQLRLAALLGEARYMKTDTQIGTGPTMVMIGLGKYLVDKGFPNAEIKYQGWRKHPDFFSSGKDIPDLDSIKKSLRGGGAAWLNIGWYKYDADRAAYNRAGGHWLTLVGYGEDREGNPAPEVLVIHDPALKKKRTGPLNCYVRTRVIEPLSSGEEPILAANPRGYFDKMADNNTDNQAVKTEQGLPRSAKGFMKLTGEMHLRNGADFAIVDGVVSLRLEKRRRSRIGQ